MLSIQIARTLILAYMLLSISCESSGPVEEATTKTPTKPIATAPTCTDVGYAGRQ